MSKIKIIKDVLQIDDTVLSSSNSKDNFMDARIYTLAMLVK